MKQFRSAALRCMGGVALAAIALTIAAGPAVAMPASPRLLERAQDDRALAARIARVEAVGRAKGANKAAGSSLEIMTGPNGLPRLQSTPRPSAVGDFKTLAILVDFSDQNSQVAATFFDDLLFKDVFGPESMRGYYREVSYGSATERGLIDVVTVNLPSAMGWKRMPQSMAYYAGTDNGMGAYPQNAQKMVEEAVLAVDSVVDFSNYDSDGDTYVDNVMVIHAGSGAEYTGDAGDIWSHAWVTSADMPLDGVKVRQYSTEPEYWEAAGDMTTGVFAHEMGHTLGLPDLYDYDGSSEGVGNWSLMGGGGWNQVSEPGDSPARLDPWSSAELGWLQPQLATGTAVRSLPGVASSRAASAWQIFPDGASSGSEYWLVENRRLSGTDAALPGSGVLIWHVDETVYNNDNENHKMVDVEEAGGVQNMDTGANRGGPEDPYPGLSNNRTFNNTSAPNSKLYDGFASNVFIDTISDDAASMTARIGAMSMSLENGNPYTADTAVTIYSNAAIASGMRVDPGTGTYGPWGDYAAFYDVTLPAGDGAKTVRVEYRDVTLASLGVLTDTITLDTAGPTVATITSTSHPVEAQWYPSDVAQMRWSGAPDLSGSAACSFEFDTSPATVPDTIAETSATNFSGPLTTDGVWYAHVRLKDNAGNWGPASHRAVRVDTVAPVLLSFSTPSHPDDTVWYAGSEVDLAWAGDDLTSLVAGASFVIDRSASTLPDAIADSAEAAFTATVDGDGVWYAHLRAVDNAGNGSAAQHRMLRVDVTAPSTTASLEDGEEYLDAAQVELTSDDGAGAGVAAIVYTLDGGEPTTYTAPFSVSSFGSHALEFSSVDAVGNAEEPQTLAFTVRASEVALVPVQGIDRYGTAVAASQLAYPDGADAVVIATGRDWPDALGASSLAGVLDAPILLVQPDSIPPAVSAEIARLGATEAVVIGGTGAVRETVASQLGGVGSLASVRRIAGTNRYETALLVSEETVELLGADYDGHVFVATGEQYADALSASPASAANGWPTVLVPSTGGVPANVRAFVSDNATSAVVLGGTGAVSPVAYNDIAGLLGAGNVTRLGGTDRFATAALAAQWFVGNAGLEYSAPAIATGRSPYDALAGGVAQGKSRSVLLLTETNSLPSATTVELLSNAQVISEVRFFGGTGAVSQTVRDAVDMLVGP